MSSSPSVVHQVLDLPAERLAAVIGSWPEPALLESGPGFGDAGRWSILAAYPRLVWEATGSRWSLHADSGVAESGEGDVLTVLADLLRRFGLAEPAEQPDPTLPPFQGGMIGFLGYDLAPRIERLPRRARARLAAARYPAGTLRHGGHGRLAHRAGRALGLGPDRRGTRGRRAALPRLAQGPRSARSGRQATDRARTDRWDRSIELIRPRDLSRDGAPRAGIHRGRRRLPGQPVAAVHGPGTSDPLDLYLRLKAESPAPFAAFLQLGRPGGRLGQPGVVLPDAGRPAGHPADQGDPAARLGPRRRRPARRRAARLAQGPRRADHDRRPRAQRPGPGLPSTARSSSATRSRSNRSPRCTTWSPRSKGGCGRTSGRST